MKITPAEAKRIASAVVKTGAFMAATCPTCGVTKRPYRDVSADDGAACRPCILGQLACPGCNRGDFPLIGNWHDEAGKWHRACAEKAGRMAAATRGMEPK